MLLPVAISFSDSVKDFTDSNYGLLALILFCAAYFLVILEDVIHLPKSKPVVLGAGIVWIIVALAYGGVEEAHIGEKVKHHVADFAELFLFLLVAMTYVHAMTERKIFMKINAILVGSGASLRTLFWATGVLAFIMSPIADNMTTALVLGAVVVTVGRGNPVFVSIGCTNVVVAANAGGAFSPFGDITTLMVWQAEKVETMKFIDILLPSIVSWLIPAFVMQMGVPKTKPEPIKEKVEFGEGWLVVIILFIMTIATATSFHAFLHLPPFLGMMTGLSYYFLYSYWRKIASHKWDKGSPVDAFDNVAAVEWDTLLFFFGVIMCVGGLAELGYLHVASSAMYDGLGVLWANISVGVLSAIIDNVPVMFAVLGMDPAMNTDQWLMVTLTAGIGGSLLSVGSAAGVALMGVAHGQYTFGRHLKWTPIIAVGYAAGIVTLLALQGRLF